MCYEKKIERRYNKKMENKKMFGLFALATIAMLSIASFANAFPGGEFSNLSEDEKLELKENKEAIKDSIKNGDYDAWKTLMEERIAKMQAQITEDRFNEIVTRHEEMSVLREALQEARESGDFTVVEELRAEYGLEGKGFAGKGHQREHFNRANFAR